MRLMRRFWSISCIALALAIGQQAALLHDLGHAMKRIHAPAQDQYPGSDSCDKCFGFSQLSGSMPGAMSAFVALDAAPVLASFVATPAPSRTVVVTRNRGPPALL